VNTQIMLR